MIKTLKHTEKIKVNISGHQALLNEGRKLFLPPSLIETLTSFGWPGMHVSGGMAS